MRIGVLCCLVASMIGCGSDQVPTYPVSGRIVFADGQPVRHGTIELASVKHRTTATGSIDHNGRFVLGTYTSDDGAVSGDHNAIIVQVIIADGSFEHTIDHGAAVPTRYAAYETSPLEVTVTPDGQNDITITISP